MFTFIYTMWSWLPQPLPVLFYGLLLFLIVVALWHIIAGIVNLVRLVLVWI